jgi:RHS repeat-associated protein
VASVANGAAYVTGPNNQLLFDGTYWYAYDAEGNRTARFIDTNGNGVLDAGDAAVTTYSWDHRNRLTRVTDYGVYGDAAVRAVDYLYDVENRWIGRDVDLGADGVIDSRTRFAYDGNQIVLQFDGADMDAPAEPLSVEHLSHRYLWNPAAVDQLMADEHVTDPAVPGDVLWPVADHLGTIRDLVAHDTVTGTTTVVNHRTFDAYGNLLSQSTTNPAHDTLFAFTGRPLDQETSLQNNLHRWYDAAVGRWMSEDPIGFEGRDGNLCAYVGNGPVNGVDHSGLWTYVPAGGRATVSFGPSTARFAVTTTATILAIFVPDKEALAAAGIDLDTATVNFLQIARLSQNNSTVWPRSRMIQILDVENAPWISEKLNLNKDVLFRKTGEWFVDTYERGKIYYNKDSEQLNEFPGFHDTPGISKNIFSRIQYSDIQYEYETCVVIVSNGKTYVAGSFEWGFSFRISGPAWNREVKGWKWYLGSEVWRQYAMDQATQKLDIRLAPVSKAMAEYLDVLFPE